MWQWGGALPKSSLFSTKIFSLWKLSESIIYFSLKMTGSLMETLPICSISGDCRGSGPLAIWAPESAAMLCAGPLGVACSFPKPHHANAVVCNRLLPRAYKKGPIAQNGLEVKSEHQTSSPVCSPPWLSLLKPSRLPFSRDHFSWTLSSRTSENSQFDCFFFLINVFIFNCRILALQCHVGFCHT